jgi:hypothetical protein
VERVFFKKLFGKLRYQRGLIKALEDKVLPFEHALAMAMEEISRLKRRLEKLENLERSVKREPHYPYKGDPWRRDDQAPHPVPWKGREWRKEYPDEYSDT